MPQSKEYGATLARGPGIWETLKEMLPGRGRPFDWVQVEVSSRCPGRCRYCPRHVWRRDWNARDMTLDTFQRLWPLMRKTTRVHLQGWGEPLDHPQFFEMAALARRAGCSVSTTTSGLPMNTELAAKLVESGLDIIAFSLAGTDSESNRVRAGIAFDRVCEAVTLLQRERRRRGGSTWKSISPTCCWLRTCLPSGVCRS